MKGGTQASIIHFRGIRVLLPTVIIGCVLLTTVLDLLESSIYGYAFYFSESVLFSSFWLIFLPLLIWQFSFITGQNRVLKNISLTVLPLFVHGLLYPGLVWLLSNLFYSHTFSYWQTLEYEVTNYSFILIAFYSLPFIAASYFRGIRRDNDTTELKSYQRSEPRVPSDRLVVTLGVENIAINTNDILYFSANSPYINIYHKRGRHLHTGTLRSLSQRLDGNVFIRVHKSVIVNIGQVSAYKSRLNGDYDLIMSDGTVLRLSRNFAPLFKEKFKGGHQDALK